ncbi:S-adenosyl-L-methionine-dependent methyltransferase [Pisolithus orientalis]|uniref:S-adenosyl-L-methionine-dependent methyltransferase n=1 Tax=Pisolithus orientalis TaxID=936130 RepID=UPI002224298A|nr:S-adenosyl-L-methionine-dependent methyltransferase [Pisolithus orientalis]KAI6033034.1 S-adenosyl-L-methionine-dependent methyltransferase [Pisolithus orientalis]
MSLLFMLRRGPASSVKCCYGKARNTPEEFFPSPRRTPTAFTIRPYSVKESTADTPRSRDDSQSIVIRSKTRSTQRKRKVTYTSDNKFHLPAQDDWSAALVADAFVPAGSKDKVIIEAFPGPGVLTRALMALPKERIRKIIVLEHLEPYLEFLKPLEAADSRVHVLPLDGYSWNSYQKLEADGYLNDINTFPWDQSHPHLHFIAHLPTSVYGEQLIAQFLRLIPDGGWLFQYGRVPMSYVMHDWLWERVSASTESLNRCKLSVIAQAVSSFAQPLSPEALFPYDQHFWPSSVVPGHRVTPMTAVTMDPLKRQARIIEKGMLDKWDYCLRKLFVLKSKKLERAIGHLAPGSTALLSYLTDPTLPTDHPARADVLKLIRKMETTDWAALVRAFDAWPFAPEDLLITESFSREGG